MKDYIEMIEGTEAPFVWVCALAMALGHRKIDSLPGILIIEIDENWKAKINGHAEEIENIPRMACSLEWNGWPAGVGDLGGFCIAAGSMANVDTFKEAILKKVKSLEK